MCVAGLRNDGTLLVGLADHSNMGNTGAFCLVFGRHKYIAFGHGFNATFGGYDPQLFDVHADPDEMDNLAPSQTDLVASLDALLRSELASGFNALSATGDYREIDVYVKRQQQLLYQHFFQNTSRLQIQYDRLCVAPTHRPMRTTAPYRFPCRRRVLRVRPTSVYRLIGCTAGRRGGRSWRPTPAPR